MAEDLDQRLGDQRVAEAAGGELERVAGVLDLDARADRPVRVAGVRSESARCRIAQSMGSRGGCYDNAVAESFFATLKKELIHRQTWPSKHELRSEVFDYIEIFYNRRRRHDPSANCPRSSSKIAPSTDHDLVSRLRRSHPLRG